MRRILGFTLVELLVVISIVGLLSSIVFASLGGAKDKATQSAFRQQVDQFLKAVEVARNSDGAAPYAYILRFSVGRNDSTDGFYNPSHQNSFNAVFKNPGYISEFPRLWKPSSGYGYVYYRRFNSSSYRCGNQASLGSSDPRMWIYILSYNSTQRTELQKLFLEWDRYRSYYPCKILN